MPLRTSSSLTLWWIGKQRAFVDGLSKVFGTFLACHKEEETMTKNSLCSGTDWATTLIGHSQKTASEYASPSEAVPRGKAPKMQVQLLNPGKKAV